MAESQQNPGSGALVLLSGGLDSATTLYLARSKHSAITGLSFDYGQRHRIELDRAAEIARVAGIEHHLIKLDASVFVGTSLVDRSMAVPEERSDEAMATGIPSTYVPGRNILFLSFALSYAEGHGLGSIYIGANAVDYSGYPDCRPEFFEAFQAMANAGTRAGQEGHPVRVETPLIRLTKAEIIRIGTDLGVDYSLTSSCYQPDDEGRPCQKCDSCQLRLRGFQQAGLIDPLTA